MLKEKYSITDKLGFRISAYDVTAFRLGKSGGRGSTFIVSIYGWELNITIKHLFLL